MSNNDNIRKIMEKDSYKIKRANVEIDIYEGAIEALERNGAEKVSMDYVKGFINDLRKILSGMEGK
jgi:Cdc6-like AAA superfamily ATPase